MFKAILVVCALVGLGAGEDQFYEPNLPLRVPEPSLVRAIMKSLNDGPVQFGGVSDFPSVMQTQVERHTKLAVNAIDGLIAQGKKFSLAVSHGACDSAQKRNSLALRRAIASLPHLWIVKHKRRLYHQKIPKTLVYRDVFSPSTSFNDLKLKNVLLKGVQDMNVSRLDFDLCAKKLEIKIDIPSLEFLADYSINGTIDSSPLKGHGALIIKIDSLSIYEKSFMECNRLLFADDVCKFSDKHRTFAMSARSVKVNVNGVRYKHLTGKKINQEINDYFVDIIKTRKLGLLRNFTDMVMTRFQSGYMAQHSPMSLLKKLKNDLKKLSLKISSQRSTFIGNNNCWFCKRT